MVGDPWLGVLGRWFVWLNIFLILETFRLHLFSWNRFWSIFSSRVLQYVDIPTIVLSSWNVINCHLFKLWSWIWSHFCSLFRFPLFHRFDLIVQCLDLALDVLLEKCTLIAFTHLVCVCVFLILMCNTINHISLHFIYKMFLNITSTALASL